MEIFTANGKPYSTKSTDEEISSDFEGTYEDWRGTGKTEKDALDKAFEEIEKATGVSKEEVKVTKWKKDVYGKSHPVEWKGPNGIEVNIDNAHEGKKMLTQPHIGYQYGKRQNKVTEHIIIDEVEVHRLKVDSNSEKEKNTLDYYEEEYK